ncbi:MAG: VanZ family protein [Spirochaetaceae bacterium]|jgi:glycopeptide antibiotics resistance protein|nr:VanZ family protein [Spirochaetaceae bacterium]
MKDNRVYLALSKRDLWFLLLVYLILIFYLLFLSPICGRTRGTRSWNILPLYTIFSILYKGYPLDTLLLNIAGNLGLLMPPAFIYPLLKKANEKKETPVKLFFMGILISLCIEGLQWVFFLGCFDVDDILLNALGFMFAWLIGQKSTVVKKTFIAV